MMKPLLYASRGCFAKGNRPALPLATLDNELRAAGQMLGVPLLGL